MPDFSVGCNSGNNDFATVFGKRKDLTEYLNDDGSVAYALLLKSEIAQMDRRLVEECKDKCQIGGLKKWNLCSRICCFNGPILYFQARLYCSVFWLTKP